MRIYYNLRWDEIRNLSEDRSSARLADSKTGPRTIWLGPGTVRLVGALPKREDDPRVFPNHLTSARLYTFWKGVREKAELPLLRIHDLRHSFASQGVINGVGLPTVGRLLGHRRRATTAMYAHFDDSALRNAADQAANVIAHAMQFPGTTPSLGLNADPNRNHDSQIGKVQGSPSPTSLDPLESPGVGTASDNRKRRSFGNDSTPHTSDTDGYRWI